MPAAGEKGRGVAGRRGEEEAAARKGAAARPHFRKKKLCLFLVVPLGIPVTQTDVCVRWAGPNRPNQIDFGHENGSARWRCPKSPMCKIMRYSVNSLLM
jgi:hypothetical protein